MGIVMVMVMVDVVMIVVMLVMVMVVLIATLPHVDPELWVHFWLNNKLLSTMKKSKDKHLNIQTFQPASIVLVEHHASANWPVSHLKN